MAKILFVYPNRQGYPFIHVGISLLSGILRHYGHEVKLFDVTFMVERPYHSAREKANAVKNIEFESCWGPKKILDVDEEFKTIIHSFNPDLIAFSVLEADYGLAKRLFKIAKETKNVPVAVGGAFPTVVPNFFLNDEDVDLICIGEGEHAILEVARRIDSGSGFGGIPNIIAKSTGEIVRNPSFEYYHWDPLVFQNWDILDPRHLLKPFMGQVHKTGSFELSRGCLHNCSYCGNLILRRLSSGLGKYHREKPIESLIAEISFMREKYALDLIFFHDENFLLMKEERFKEFCRQYKAIGLPFFMTTRAETLLDETKVETLKNIGCITIGIGVETGNELMRAKLLNKKTPNEIFERAFAICNKVGIRTSAFIMIGLPFETEENIIETVSFCRKIKPTSISHAIFAPYYGTALRQECIKNGFIEDRYYENMMLFESILTMPQISQHRLEELYFQLNDLIYKD